MNQRYKEILIDARYQCELCGCKRGIEVHHILPKVISKHYVLDIDSKDNLLVQMGIQDARKPKDDPRILTFMESVDAELEDGNRLSANDILDVFFEVFQVKTDMKEIAHG